MLPFLQTSFFGSQTDSCLPCRVCLATGDLPCGLMLWNVLQRYCRGQTSPGPVGAWTAWSWAYVNSGIDLEGFLILRAEPDELLSMPADGRLVTVSFGRSIPVPGDSLASTRPALSPWGPERTERPESIPSHVRRRRQATCAWPTGCFTISAVVAALRGLMSHGAEVGEPDIYQPASHMLWELSWCCCWP